VARAYIISACAEADRLEKCKRPMTPGSSAELSIRKRWER